MVYVPAGTTHTLLQSVASGYPFGLALFLYLGSIGILLCISLRGRYHCPPHCRVLLCLSTNTGKISLILSASKYGQFFFRGTALGIISGVLCFPCGGCMLHCAHSYDFRFVVWLRLPTLPPLEMCFVVALVSAPLHVTLTMWQISPRIGVSVFSFFFSFLSCLHQRVGVSRTQKH